MAAQEKVEVRLLTRHPERWADTLNITTPDRGTLHGPLSLVTSDAERAMLGTSIVLLCLPGYAIGDTLRHIRPYLSSATAVGSIVSSTGYFFEAMNLLPADVPLFGFQRVPFIARTVDYGRAARLMGYKPLLKVCIERTDAKEPLRQQLESLLKTPIHLLDNYYEASLTNSNPLLHPARLFTMWHDWQPGVVYDDCCKFYADWTVEASEAYLTMDDEFQQLLKQLPISEGSIPTVLDYYESTDALSLTHKLRSITAFQSIKAPMRQVPGGYVPDFQSRYFTEDFPYGLSIVHRLAQQHGVSTPLISEILAWGKSKLSAF